MAAAQTTVIEGGIVVAYDGSEHRIIEGGHVAFAGDRVVSVGSKFAGTAATRIDARGKLVMPGLINTHAHAGIDPGGRMIVDAGRRDLWRFMYKNRVHERGAVVMEQDRKALSSIPKGARRRENLLQCDIGVARIRRMYRDEMERHVRALESVGRAAE